MSERPNTPLDRERLASNPAKLPALGTPDSPGFMARVKETLEVLTGRRGESKWDRAVTFRDLEQAYPGLSSMNDGRDRNGGAARLDIGSAALDAQIRHSAAYKTLMAKIGSVEDLEAFPDEIRAVLRKELGKLALERGAAIEETREIIRDANKSFAQKVTEITASFDNMSAGVRHLDSAYAMKNRALATSLTQVTARINNADGPGTGVTIEEKFLAIADVNTGLLGQWAVKIQAGSDANPVIAGLGLSVEGPNANELTSSLVFMADKFGMYTPSGVINPFSADEFGVNINGDLRLNGTLLEDLVAGAQRLQLISSSQVFQVSKTGTVSPATITFTALDTSLAGSPAFTITQAGGSPVTLSGSGNSRSVAYADLTGDSAEISCTWDGKSDTITVVKLREGQDSVIGFLTNEASVLAASSAGVVSDFAPAGGTFKVYQGTVDKTTSSAFSVSSQTGCTVSINATSGAYTVSAMSLDTATAVLQAVYGGVTLQKVLSLSKSKQGSTGSPGADGTTTYTWIKYADDASGGGLSDSPAGKLYIGIAANKTTATESTNPALYTWALIKGTDGLPGNDGADGVTTYTWIKYADVADGTGLYDTPTSSTLYIGIATNKTTATESTVKTDYVWSKFKGDQGVPGSNGSNGANGARGSMMFYLSGYTSWDSSAATTAASTGGGPIVGDTVTEYGSNWAQTRNWTGSAWSTITQTIDGNLVVSGSVTASAFAANIFTGYEFIGSVFKTSSGTSSRITINESSNNKLLAYNSSNTVIAEIGGSSGVVYVPSTSGTIPAVYGISPGAGLVAGVYGKNTSSGIGVFGDAGSGVGVRADATSGKGLRVSATTGDAIEIAGGTNAIVQTGGGSNYLRSTLPATDNTYSLGASGVLRWTALYAMSATITTSDVRTKNSIEDSPLGLSFINDLRPIRYLMNVGENVVTDNFVEVEPERVEVDDDGNEHVIPAVIENQPVVTQRAGTRFHYGLPAQQLRETLLAHGEDNAAMWCLTDPNDPESQQAVRYEELVPVLIKALQEASAQILYLQMKDAAFEERLAALEAK